MNKTEKQAATRFLKMRRRLARLENELESVRSGGKTRIEQAVARTEHAEMRTEQAKTRAEAAETRAGQAEMRIEALKSRLEHAETRAEQAELRAAHLETAVQNELRRETGLREKGSSRLVHFLPVKKADRRKSPLELLTERQRKILQLIAEGQNTKQIAQILKISPKTVEYHRMRLMECLKVYEVSGLVRLAMREGLVPQET